MGGREKYPVFYLLHGAADNDDAWASVAAPISSSTTSLRPRSQADDRGDAGWPHQRRTLHAWLVDEFLNDFSSDVVPMSRSITAC